MLEFVCDGCGDPQRPLDDGATVMGRPASEWWESVGRRCKTCRESTPTSATAPNGTKPPDELCPTCGAKVVQYKHTLNKGLAQGLLELFRAGRPANVDQDLRLTYSQKCNFQKLRYWGLAERQRRGGLWVITDRGTRFAQGSLSIPKAIWTYRGEPERFDGQRIYIWEAVGGYQSRQEWAAAALPVPVP